MWYWSVAILFWQLSIVHIVNGQYKRYGFAKTRLRHPSLPFHSLPYLTRTICRRLRTLGQSRNNQAKRGWPYSMSMGLCPAIKKKLCKLALCGSSRLNFVLKLLYHLLHAYTKYSTAARLWISLIESISSDGVEASKVQLLLLSRFIYTFLADWLHIRIGVLFDAWN